MKLTLLSSTLILVLFTGCTAAINRLGNGNATGYGGGDPALTVLDSIRSSLILAFQSLEERQYECKIPAGYIPGGLEGRPLWGLLHDLSEDQSDFCKRYLKNVSIDALSRLEQPVQELFQVSEAAELFDDTNTPVRAKTNRDVLGSIIILRSAVDGLSRRTLATLIVHELLHKMIPKADLLSPALPTEFVRDDQDYGPFSDGRRLLDTLGVRLALHLAQQEGLDCVDGTLSVPELDLCRPIDPSELVVSESRELPRVHWVGGDSQYLARSVPLHQDGSLGPQRIDGDFQELELRINANGSSVMSLGVGDMDGDGRREILFVNGSGDLLVVMMSADGISEIRTYTDWFPSFRAGQDEIRPLGIGDLDGDGLDDLILFNDETGEAMAFTLEGESLRSVSLGLVSNTGIQLQIVEPEKRRTALVVGVGDIDGDGKAEILVVDKRGKIFATRLLSSGLSPKEELANIDDLGIPKLHPTNPGEISLDMVDTDGDGYDDFVLLGREGEVKIVRFVMGQPNYARDAGNLERFKLHANSKVAKELSGLFRWWWEDK